MPSIKELFDLTGRVAIVTGGSRGLGEEMAEGLAEAGASLMLCARREQWLTPTLESFRGRGFKVEGMVCDVSVPEQVQAVVDKTIADLRTGRHPRQQRRHQLGRGARRPCRSRSGRR